MHGYKILSSLEVELPNRVRKKGGKDDGEDDKNNANNTQAVVIETEVIF